MLAEHVLSISVGLRQAWGFSSLFAGVAVGIGNLRRNAVPFANWVVYETVRQTADGRCLECLKKDFPTRADDEFMT